MSHGDQAEPLYYYAEYKGGDVVVTQWVKIQDDSFATVYRQGGTKGHLFTIPKDISVKVMSETEGEALAIYSDDLKARLAKLETERAAWDRYWAKRDKPNV